MHLCILLQPQHHPIPDDITVVQNYGEERIMIDPPEGSNLRTLFDCKQETGESVLVTGTEEAFQNWLRPFPGVWICNNPMMGDWRVVHIKQVAQESASK